MNTSYTTAKRATMHRAALLLALAASFCLALGFGAPSALAAQDEALSVGNAQLSAQATSKVMHRFADVASGTVAWDASTNTVTMTNATIDLDKQSSKYVYYGISVDGELEYPTPTITLKLVGANVIKGGGTTLSGAVYVNDANLKVVGPGSLTTQCPGATYACHVDGSLTAESGTMSVMGGNSGFHCEENFLLSGAKLSVKDTRGSGVNAEGKVTLRKGSLTVNGAQYNGVYADSGPISLSGAKVAISNAKYAGIYTSQGAVSITAGTLTIAKCESGVSCDKAFAIGGKSTKATMSSLESSGVYSDGFTMKAGKLTVKSCGYGVSSKSSASVSGGTLSITGASEVGLQAMDGTLRVKGGSATVKCTKSNVYALYGSKKVLTKPSSLKAIKGTVGAGATIKANGSTYVVGDYGDVMLKSYGSSKKSVSVNAVWYGGRSYDIETIAAKAFATKQGKALTALALGKNVRTIGANAFKGTSSLKTLNIANFYYYSASMNKKAFAQCGKAGGADLTVRCKYNWECKSAREKLTAAGLSHRARFTA